MSTNVAQVPHEVTEARGERDELVNESQPFVPGGLLTVSEVANAMRVSNMTVYRLIKNGELPAVRVGKNYRLRETDLERFLEERSVRTEGP